MEKRSLGDGYDNVNLGCTVEKQAEKHACGIDIA